MPEDQDKSYRLVPLNGNIAVVPLTPKEVKEHTSKALVDPHTDSMHVLSYGRVVHADTKLSLQQAALVSNFTHELVDFGEGDIILYQKLASHKTNFGSPRQVLVPIENIEGKLEVENDQTA